jgi:16S rRNA (uracil1498-N3)-methyltransferase
LHRFFVSPELLQETNIDISLPKELAHQVRDVIRLGIDEQLLLLDNSGDEILAAIAKTSKTSVEVHLIERRPGSSEPAVRIILCQGLLKSTRFEWILEKGTELGVSVFSPIICSRSMSGLEYTGSSKIQRWQRIIQEAAEQCGRWFSSELLCVRPLVDALNDMLSDSLAMMPWEEEHSLTLRDALNSSNLSTRNAGATLEVVRPSQMPTTIFLFIGPEGGLMTEEVALAQRRGVQVVTLGARTLRAETAAIATVANVMYELER